MSHEFLLYAHGCSGLVQPSTICVTERVKPDPAKSQFQTCRNQVPIPAAQSPQPTLQDNTDSNVQELKNQIEAERQKERQANSLLHYRFDLGSG